MRRRNKRVHPILLFLGRFWAPVPWMLEATIILELTLARYTEAAVIGALLLFNAVLSLMQESRAPAWCWMRLWSAFWPASTC